MVDAVVGKQLHMVLHEACVSAILTPCPHVLRRSAAVMGFRAGMLCYLLENRKYTKTVGQFAEWVAEYVFRNQMELWGEQMEQSLETSIDFLKQLA